MMPKAKIISTNGISTPKTNIQSPDFNEYC